MLGIQKKNRKILRDFLAAEGSRMYRKLNDVQWWTDEPISMQNTMYTMAVYAVVLIKRSIHSLHT